MACERCRGALNSCDARPFVPPRGSVRDVLFICPQCGQHWWQDNVYYHLWRDVSPETYAGLRRELLDNAGITEIK